MIKRSDNLKTLFLLFSIVFFIVFIPFVSSASPFQTTQQFTEGLVLKYPADEILKLNQDYEFEFHVFNISNGLAETGKIVCYFHLYNSTGKHQLELTDNAVSHTFDYSFFVKGGNFSEVGEYYYITYCESTDGLGGYVEEQIIVTTTGEDLTAEESILYFLVTLFAFGIFLLVTWLFLSINGENPRDETGFLGINYRKYIKTALFPLVYVTFLWFFNFIIGLSGNYLGLALYSETLGFIFMVLTKLIYPIIVLTLVVEIVLMVKDSNIEREYKSLWNKY